MEKHPNVDCVFSAGYVSKPPALRMSVLEISRHKLTAWLKRTMNCSEYSKQICTDLNTCSGN